MKKILKLLIISVMLFLPFFSNGRAMENETNSWLDETSNAYLLIRPVILEYIPFGPEVPNFRGILNCNEAPALYRDERPGTDYYSLSDDGQMGYYAVLNGSCKLYFAYIEEGLVLPLEYDGVLNDGEVIAMFAFDDLTPAIVSNNYEDLEYVNTDLSGVTTTYELPIR